MDEVDVRAEEETPRPAGPATNLVVALSVVASGIAGVAASWWLGVGTASAPRPGTWPFLLSITLTGLGVALTVRAKVTADAEKFTSSSWLVLAGVATMVLFVAVVGVIGFEVPATALAFVWLRFLGGESWRMSAVVSVASVGAIYVIFVGLLAIPIPHLF